MKHKEKRRLAIKMRTPEEAQRTDRKAHEGIFDSKAWEARKAGIAARVARKQKAADRAVARREAAAGTTPTILTRAKRMIRAAADRRQKARGDRAAAYARKHQTV